MNSDVAAEGQEPVWALSEAGELRSFALLCALTFATEPRTVWLASQIWRSQMSWNKWNRQFHRWFSVAFTLGFIVNLAIALSGKEPPFWVYLLVLIPLFLLLPTGLYMFAQPYVMKRRGAKDRPSER